VNKQENSTLGLEAEGAGVKAENEARDSAGKKRRDGAKEQAMAQAHKVGGKSLILLQVNCRSIYNKP